MDTVEKGAKLLVIHHIHDGMILLWIEALSEHHLNPGILPKELRRNLKHPSRLLKKLDTMFERVGYFHAAAVTPKRRIGAIGDVIVQDDEIPDVFDFKHHLVVELINIWLAHPVVGEHLHKSHHCPLDQMNTG